MRISIFLAFVTVYCPCYLNYFISYFQNLVTLLLLLTLLTALYETLNDHVSMDFPDGSISSAEIQNLYENVNKCYEKVKVKAI